MKLRVEVNIPKSDQRLAILEDVYGQITDSLHEALREPAGEAHPWDHWHRPVFIKNKVVGHVDVSLKETT